MLDIVEILDGADLKVADSAVTKAANVLAVQIGDLEYAKAFGVDLKFFIQEELQFPNDSFQSYLTQRLIENQINVSQVITLLQSFLERYTFFVGDAKKEQGLIA